MFRTFLTQFPKTTGAIVATGTLLQAHKSLEGADADSYPVHQPLPSSYDLAVKHPQLAANPFLANRETSKITLDMNHD
jgi:hypothetical protein